MKEQNLLTIFLRQSYPTLVHLSKSIFLKKTLYVFLTVIKIAVIWTSQVKWQNKNDTDPGCNILVVIQGSYMMLYKS